MKKGASDEGVSLKANEKGEITDPLFDDSLFSNLVLAYFLTFFQSTGILESQALFF